MGFGYSTIATPEAQTWGDTLTLGNIATANALFRTFSATFGSSDEHTIADNGGDLQIASTSGSIISIAQSGTDNTTFTIGNSGNATLIKSGLASASKIVFNVGTTAPTMVFTTDTTGSPNTHTIAFTTPTAPRTATFQDASGTIAYLSDIPAAPTTLYSGDGSLSGNRTVTQGANTLAFTATAVNAFSVDGTTFSVDASNNRVGVGTAAPTAKLHIIGNGATSSTTALNIVKSDLSASFIVRDDGYVGIGVTPSVALHVQNNTGVRIQSPTGGYGDINIIPYSPSQSYDSIDFNSGEELRVGGAFGAKTNKWRFLSGSGTNAQIGVNTDSPGATLDMVGNGNSGLTNILNLKDSSSVAKLTLRDDGLMGLGVAPIANVTFATTGRISFASLPTSSAGLGTGEIWNNSGVINIV